MKIDLYTKAILTVIAIGVGCLVFEQKPVKEAQAARSLEQRVNRIELKLRSLDRFTYQCDIGTRDWFIEQMRGKTSSRVAYRLWMCVQKANDALVELSRR